MHNIPFNHQRNIKLLQRLIQFDTTNPPGNEVACLNYMSDLLQKAGFETILVGAEPNRPNLITRLKGKGLAPPLLLYGHVDVVTIKNQDWKYPPFSGKIVEGDIWGRGTLDMKGGVAMMTAALLNLKEVGYVPDGDIILAIVSDEEAGGQLGAQYLVENHSEHFKGVRHAIGEFGGFPLYIGGQKFYAIQVAEKQVSWLRGTVRGQGGHASLPTRDGVMAKLAGVLQALNDNRLPVHIDPVLKEMCQLIAANTPSPFSEMFAGLIDTTKTDTILDKMGASGKIFDAILHNTVNITVINGGNKTNVIPSEINLELDGRLLPGFQLEDLIQEIKDITGDDLELEVLLHSPGSSSADLSKFSFFSDILKQMDPEAIPIPLLLSGSTDARHFARLGIQTYGFLPMNLKEDFNMLNYIHAANERLPVEAFKFGIEAIQQALMTYGQ